MSDEWHGRARDGPGSVITHHVSLITHHASLITHHTLTDGPQVYWTRETEEALIKGGLKGLKEYEAKCTEQLDEVVRLVRTDLSKLQRTTYIPTARAEPRSFLPPSH